MQPAGAGLSLAQAGFFGFFNRNGTASEHSSEVPTVSLDRVI